MSTTTQTAALRSEIALLMEQKHPDPHRFLGLHKTENGHTIRLFRPGAKEIHVEIGGKIVPAELTLDVGLFEVKLLQAIHLHDYRVFYENGLLANDPYAFWPTFGEVDAFLFNKGCHYELYKVLGAHLKTHQGVKGVQFAVWAPNAQGVSLVGDFNHWDGRLFPMRSMGASGVWELFVPGLSEWDKYKFEIHAKEGYLRIKSDPYGFYQEVRPKNASLIYDVYGFAWKDQEWMEKRSQETLNRPISIYEVHLGSWRNYGKNPWGSFPGYRQIAVDLAVYVKKMGFTHVEILPVLEHPLDESWGYQVTGFFAVTSRYGTPSDFQYFVDHMHQNGIGVILDWVPGHFPTDDNSLNRFDGTALYEHEDPRKGMHPHWHTAIFNYGRKEVANFLLASALFWLEVMHLDGLRVDAVASMLYLDYGRKEGEWIPNPDGGNINHDAVEFLKHLNSIVRQRVPGALMIAEESSSFIGVTHQQGLNFDLKWNMGWMNDTLRYFSKDPIYRNHHQNDLTFSLLYAFNERFLSVLSHDEVVHEKQSLLAKMPGPDWQKFANVRLLYSYLICHPGKKLLFMGGEIGQWNEWNAKGEIDWFLLQYPLHSGLQKMVMDINHFYLTHKALWESDFEWQGFAWIDFSDAANSVISYLRKAEGQYLACVHNFTPEYRENYEVKLASIKEIQEVFNSDALEYGGSNQCNKGIAVHPHSFTISLAPLATMIFEVTFG